MSDADPVRAFAASRPPPPEGAVRRLGHALLQARLFGAPLPRLGRFEVTRKLGEGGMGAVFEALDPTLGRTVALKLLRHPEGGGPRPDLGHEARMLARLSHPNVVTVYELGEADGERYVCMEWVDGPNLAGWLAEHPDASWRERARLLRGAAAGLAAAHRAGVVHRDFKLENVLVGADGVPRVTDFGLARAGEAVPDVVPEAPPASAAPTPPAAPTAPAPAPTPPAVPTAPTATPTAAPTAPAALPRSVLPPAASRAPRTRSGFAGTPGYLAPEVLAGGRATPRSDQYAFGVALRRAFEGAPEPPPEALRRLAEAASAPDPEARLPDLDAVGAALEAALSRPAGPDQRAREVLLARVAQLWVEPLRDRALGLAGEVPLGVDGPPAGAGTSGARAGAGPLGVALATEGGGAEALASALVRLHARVVLLGAPGAGKTVRLLGVADLLRRRAADDPDAPLPVVLPLSGFAGFGGPFEAWVGRELVARYALPREQVAEWLAAGRLVLLLDGLDELPPDDRPRCAAALDALHQLRPTAFLLTSREERGGALPALPAHDALLRLRDLDAEALGAALLRAGLPPTTVAAVAADPDLADALRNPLLLSLFVEQHGELDGRGEAAGLRERLYARALAHALDRPPALDGDARARAEAAVRGLAAMLERAGASGLWLEDLQAAWLPTPAARVGAVALGLGAAYGLSLALNLAAARVAQLPWYSGAFFGLLAVSAALVIQGGVKVAPMERMGWSWARVWRWIPGLLVLGVVTGGLHGLFFDLWADLLLGVATGLLGVSVIGLVPAGRERRVVPGEGLWESLRNSLVVAPLVGLVIGVPVGYLVLPLARPLAAPDSMYHTHPDPSLAWAVTIGTSATVTSLFITGALAPLMHLAIRVVLCLALPLPWRLGAWLDALAARGLVHRVGGGWVFRHATFRAWLAGATARG